MKLVPVILISTCCMRRRYSAAEYVAATLMIVSAASSVSARPKSSPISTFWASCFPSPASWRRRYRTICKTTRCATTASPSTNPCTTATAPRSAGCCSSASAPASSCRRRSFRRVAAGDGAAAATPFFYLGAYVYQLLLKDSGAVRAVAVMTVRKSPHRPPRVRALPKPWSSSHGWGLVLGAAIAIDLRMRWRRDAAPTAAVPLLEKEPR